MTAPENWQKSPFSGGGDGSSCLGLSTALHLHESDAPAAVLTTSPAPLARLLDAIRTGIV